MSEPVRILEATSPEQLEDVRTLLMEYAVSLGWDIASTSLAGELEEMPGAYGPPRGVLLLAYADGELAGIVGLRPIPADAATPGMGAEGFGELKRLFVRDRFRRRGVARALMRRAEEEARRRGYSALVLTTSPEMMPLAQPMYDGLGYVETAPYRTDMNWPNIRWMRKDL